MKAIVSWKAKYRNPRQSVFLINPISSPHHFSPLYFYILSTYPHELDYNYRYEYHQNNSCTAFMTL